MPYTPVYHPRSSKSTATGRQTAARKNALAKNRAHNGGRPGKAMEGTVNRTAAAYATYNEMLKNPFLSKHGVQLMDEFRGFTCALSLSQTIPMITSDSETFSGIKFRPSLEDFYSTNNGASTLAVNTWNNYAEHFEYSAGQQLSLSVNRYRILAYAVSVQYIGPEDSMAGTISYIHSNTSGQLPTDASTWPDTHSQGAGILPITRKQFTMVSRCFDRPSFKSIEDDCESYIGGMGLVFNGVNFNHILLKTRVMVELIPRAESSLADTAVPSPGGTPQSTPPVSTASFTT